MNLTIKKFIISPPFGSYISHNNATSVMGTYTDVPRPGKLLQVLKTLRYTKQGWVNNIGLRNPGIKSIKLWDPSKIYSVWGDFDGSKSYNFSIYSMVAYMPSEIMVEINISCPNIFQQKASNNSAITAYCNRFSLVILKISPLSTLYDIESYLNSGVKYLHISNTLPTPHGGLSGRELQKYTLPLIKQVKTSFPDIKVIGGGGIYDIDDLHRYEDAGADHFSLATVWFTPWRALRLLTTAN